MCSLKVSRDGKGFTKLEGGSLGQDRWCDTTAERGRQGLSGSMGRWDGTIWFRCHAIQPKSEQREEIALLVVPRPAGALPLQVPPSRSHSRQPHELNASREQASQIRSQRVRIQFTPTNHPELHCTPLPALPLPAVARRPFQDSTMGGMLHPHASMVSRWLHGREEIHQRLRVGHRCEWKPLFPPCSASTHGAAIVSDQFPANSKVISIFLKLLVTRSRPVDEHFDGLKSHMVRPSTRLVVEGQALIPDGRPCI